MSVSMKRNGVTADQMESLLWQAFTSKTNSPSTTVTSDSVNIVMLLLCSPPTSFQSEPLSEVSEAVMKQKRAHRKEPRQMGGKESVEVLRIFR